MRAREVKAALLEERADLMARVENINKNHPRKA